MGPSFVGSENLSQWDTRFRSRSCCPMTIEVELDQSWDLLRQRRVLRAAGQDPNKVQVRPAGIVQKYVQ
jgi:hypothetical protein